MLRGIWCANCTCVASLHAYRWITLTAILSWKLPAQAAKKSRRLQTQFGWVTPNGGNDTRPRFGARSRTKRQHSSKAISCKCFQKRLCSCFAVEPWSSRSLLVYCSQIYTTLKLEDSRTVLKITQGSFWCHLKRPGNTLPWLQWFAALFSLAKTVISLKLRQTTEACVLGDFARRSVHDRARRTRRQFHQYCAVHTNCARAS